MDPISSERSIPANSFLGTALNATGAHLLSLLEQGPQHARSSSSGGQSLVGSSCTVLGVLAAVPKVGALSSPLCIHQTKDFTTLQLLHALQEQLKGEFRLGGCVLIRTSGFSLSAVHGSHPHSQMLGDGLCAVCLYLDPCATISDDIW
eukprot:CAMPEP_0170631468 /NCGR_PEP_ID=MMETSP0224-20130122/34663_1 /TAXON_ID=285029 /ORGANISM="Togula jolla, Strain CCCM 725" /LENGTH=147 /DNA_ID=CAMNT_0010959821 /DNA_START=197 /DNA_END=640 /DNA_ORIENTATION=-